MTHQVNIKRKELLCSFLRVKDHIKQTAKIMSGFATIYYLLYILKSTQEVQTFQMEWHDIFPGISLILMLS